MGQLSKLSGYFCTAMFDIHIFYVLPTLRICVFCVDVRTVTVSYTALTCFIIETVFSVR